PRQTTTGKQHGCHVNYRENNNLKTGLSLKHGPITTKADKDRKRSWKQGQRTFLHPKLAKPGGL
ncbi:MAG: hypothetical protein JXB10_01490, partial [Pirellulales bacterium]|nr:hypothetical protein [Pirellulales bacterium]